MKTIRETYEICSYCGVKTTGHGTYKDCLLAVYREIESLLINATFLLLRKNVKEDDEIKRQKKRIKAIRI